MAGKVKIPTIFTAVDKYSRTVNKMTKTTQNFAGKSAVALARVERGARRLTPSFGRLQKSLGGFGSLIAGFGAFQIESNVFNSVTDFGTFVPPIAITFLIPYFNRFITSRLPSTKIIASLFSMFGPAGQ